MNGTVRLRRWPVAGRSAACAWGLLAFAIVASVGRAETLVERHARACQALWQAREARVSEVIRRELAETDPHQSGLVGIEDSDLTSTPGYLDAKQCTTRAEWIEVLRGWFRRLNLQPGDRVAIGSSGSMPGFLLAARLAAESMDLEPVIIASLTASNYGANIEAFDLLHMEVVLLREGIVRVPLRAITPGGNRDRNHGAEPALQAHVTRRLAELGGGPIEVLQPQTIREAYEVRMRLFFAEAGAKVFINIGGHAINYGSGVRALGLPGGLVDAASVPPSEGDAEVLSITLQSLRRGTPVINLLNVRGLAESAGIPYP